MKANDLERAHELVQKIKKIQNVLVVGVTDGLVEARGPSGVLTAPIEKGLARSYIEQHLSFLKTELAGLGVEL